MENGKFFTDKIERLVYLKDNTCCYRGDETFLMEVIKELCTFNNFYGGYEIGVGTKVGKYCDIAGKIGKNCWIQSFAIIPSGVTIEDNVFIGPRVTFTNDKHPPSVNWTKILVKQGASIGAGVVILPGIVIGRNAKIGAGSIVTKDIPDGETWFGNPAKKYVKDNNNRE